MVLDVEVVLVLEAVEVLDPDVAPVLLPNDDPTEADPPLTLALLVTFDDPDPPEALLDPPLAVLPPPRVELVPEPGVPVPPGVPVLEPGVPVPEPGVPVFDAPPHAATMVATNATANDPPRNMPVQGPGSPHLRPTKRWRRG